MTARLLAGELGIHRAEDRHDVAARGSGTRGRVAVLVGEGLPERATLVVGRQRTQRAVHHQQALRPRDAVLAGKFVDEAEHAHAVVEVGGNQARLGGEAFGQVELIVPQRTRAFVVPDRDRCAGLRGPRDELALRAFHADGEVGCALVGRADRRVVEPFHVEDALARLAPRAGYGIGAEDQAQAAHAARRGHGHVLELQIVEADFLAHGLLPLFICRRC
ncbi:MAG: hypothetical protein RLW62_06295 [Gammaproteobacteria bacterium]